MKHPRRLPVLKVSPLEMSATEYFGEGFNWLQAQFQGFVYDNEIMNEVYTWMVDNCKEPWFWFESEVNHGHSFSTDVYIQNLEEQTMFALKWNEHFKFREWANIHNEDVLRKRAETDKSNV